MIVQSGRPPLEVLIEALVALRPPQHGVHVGAGAGAGVGSVHAWSRYPVPSVTLIDAQPRRMSWVACRAADAVGWRVLDAVVAASGGSAPWNLASDPEHSGLVDVVALNALWPGLRATRDPVEVPTQSLDAVLENAAGAADRPPPTWLVVDCLPAEAVLRGAEGTLRTVEVVILRSANGLPAELSWSTAELTAYMVAAGYTLLGSDTSLHPALAHQAYLRRPAAPVSSKEPQ